MRYLLIAFVLVGCNAQQVAMEKTERMERVYGPSCEKLGYKPGTEQYADCLIKLSDRRR